MGHRCSAGKAGGKAAGDASRALCQAEVELLCGACVNKRPLATRHPGTIPDCRELMSNCGLRRTRPAGAETRTQPCPPAKAPSCLLSPPPRHLQHGQELSAPWLAAPRGRRGSCHGWTSSGEGSQQKPRQPAQTTHQDGVAPAASLHRAEQRRQHRPKPAPHP